MISSPSGTRRQEHSAEPNLIEPSALFPSVVLALRRNAILSFMPLLAEKRQIGNPGLFFKIMGVVMLHAARWDADCYPRNI